MKRFIQGISRDQGTLFPEASSATEYRLSKHRGLRPLWIFWHAYGHFQVCWLVQNLFNKSPFFIT